MAGIISEHQILEEVVPKVTKFKLWRYNFFILCPDSPRAMRPKIEKTKQNKTAIMAVGPASISFSRHFFNIWSLNTIANAYEPSNMKPFP